MDVQAALAPILRAANVPFHHDVETNSVSAEQSGALDEIGKAWDLLRSGAITQEEYQQVKDGCFRKP